MRWILFLALLLLVFIAIPQALHDFQSIRTTNGISFSKGWDTLYISETLDKTFPNGKTYAKISYVVFGTSDSPQKVEIKWNPMIDAYHPVLSSDGQWLYFNSRSDPSGSEKSIPHNIWIARNENGNWKNPEVLETINSDFYDSYPSVSRNGNLYFNSDRPGGKGGMDIYLAVWNGESYNEPVNIKNLNSNQVENDLSIAPDESYIIFNRYFHESRSIDLFISFWDSGAWSTPEPITLLNAPDQWELTPTISADGQYFFYELHNKIRMVPIREIMQEFNRD